ncbi:MAG: CHRD domain-containing protein [Candidatus Eremiobacteraeota bacterium]|nr:CHRD domain-containing protein [Candidatus Eremiobacteraeota bacterium]
MNAYRLGAFALAAAMLAPACAFAASDSLTVPMKALNDSGETGTAVLTQQDDGVHVVVTLKNAPKDTAQPTHIHIGTCGNINKAPEYALVNTVDGKGDSVVKGVKLSDLTSGKYAINVHKSGDDLGTYVSCGDIK